MNEIYKGINQYDPVNTLKQHGVLGMKWGIWNPETRARYLGSRKRKINQKDNDVKYYSQNAKKANDIYKTLTDEEKHHLTGNAYDDSVPYFDKKYETPYNYKRATVYSFITQVQDVPVSMIDVYNHGDKGMISIAVRNDEKYRGKGYAKDSVKRALEWFEQNPDILQLDWAAFADNYGSQKLAEKMGFKLNKQETDDKVKVYSYRKKRKTLLKDGQAEFDKEYINLTNRVYKNPDMQGWSMKKYTTMKEARNAYAKAYADKKLNKLKGGK